jgi:cell division septation protein DedD
MKLSSPSRGAWLLTIILPILLVAFGCAPPPRAVEHAPQGEKQAAPAADADAPSKDNPYDLESEGTFPPPEKDVQFEEDALPAPESVSGDSVSIAPVQSEDLESLPDLEESEADTEQAVPAQVATPVPPETTTPVPQETVAPVEGEAPARGQRGFRVQLAAVGDHAEAERLAREARTRLGVEVYVVLEGPYFKVRAGDFVDRGDAILLRDRARGDGYPQAWVTPTEIHPSGP